ncbi:MAG: DUF2189 domain-containing protein [Betaproteobacteria bacterium]
MRNVAPGRVLHWLACGWRDLWRSPAASLLHGVIVAVGGWLALALPERLWWILPGAVSGFVLVGPILCTGLYELSRLQSRGERPGLADVVNAWRRESRPLVRVGVLLFAGATLWVLVSALLFKLFVRVPITTPVEFLRYAAMEQGNLLFTLWLLLGGLGVAVVFAVTAVSPPLLLGRMVGFRRALLTSARAVGDNPVTMGLWAAVVLTLVALSLATAMLGFIFAVPVLGHATWHAHKDLVVTDGVPLRYE